MFIQRKILFFYVIYMLMNTIIFASEEPKAQQATTQDTIQTSIQKIESWASIASDATYSSWQDTQSDFLTFLEKIDQIRILAANNSFFEDDEDDSDEEEEDDASVSGDEIDIEQSYPINNNIMSQLLTVNLMQIKNK